MTDCLISITEVRASETFHTWDNKFLSWIVVAVCSRMYDVHGGSNK